MAKKILVVDDSSNVRQLVATTLSLDGYEVVEAADGREGLSRIQQNQDFGLVISDISMPNMNGLEMLARIKADAKNSGLPVIMLTTEGEPGLIQQAKLAGAKAWIIKPFKTELFLATVRKIVGPP
jgi:two-component system chemotaxis response regulator CheY